jgi:regulator of protease activity HflC (stomatin/prohibitin superfamily)
MTFLFIALLTASLLFAVYKSLGLHKDSDGDTSFKFNIFKAIPGVILAIPFLLLAMSYTEVTSGSVGVVYRQGKAVRAIQPGPHLLVPFIESAGTVSVKTLTVSPNEDGASSDLQLVTTQVTLAYHFDPAFAIYFATQLIDSSPNAVETKAVNPGDCGSGQGRIRAVTSRPT